MVAPRNIGILGGSFNPIHVGHLLIAEDVREALALEKILFVVAPRPWMKDDASLAPAEARWDMVRLAIQSNPHAHAPRLDMDRSGQSYAVDTLRDLRRNDPAAQHWFIMGADSLDTLSQWRDVHDLLALCRIAAVPRPGVDAQRSLAALDRAIPGAAARVAIVPAALIDVSATDIRRRVREGRSIAYRVPPAVESYIRDHSLYRA
ncbi:MAG: nicotinate-nucleotide adenylyltransferase [Dehalococcoidia bacterium]|nr:nicotinate-nucleotide adenylyltransferase [Dehalococcoidia bacterium]